MRRLIHAIDGKLARFDLPIRLASGVIVAFSLFLVLATLFVDLASEVRDQETMEADRQILLWINEHSLPFLDRVMPLLTDLGGFIGVIAATAVFAGLAILRRNYRIVAHVVMSVGGAAVINLILKAIFERERPDLWVQLVTESSYSFPSGHAMASAALAFSIFVALWGHGVRKWVIPLGVSYIVFVGFSRMYLGVHYPSDIIAGWLVSGAWVTIVTWLLGTSRAKAYLAKLNHDGVARSKKRADP